ncbi:MAG: hypothetical protein GW949_05645 [Spirochaetales bacterium]|nr:hypothetical protein [Spirochaetales bacterium]
MKTLLELLQEVDMNLERTSRPEALLVLNSFAAFIFTLADLNRTDLLIVDADEYDQLALELLREIGKMDSEYGPAYAQLGYYFVNRFNDREKLKNALGLLEKARISAIQEPDILTYTAKALHKMNEPEKAFEKASLAIKVNPNNIEAFQIRSYYLHLKRQEHAPHYKKRGRRKKTEANPAESEAESMPESSRGAKSGNSAD